MAGEQRVPVDLIAGRAHAGKTTCINALLNGPYRGQHVIVFTNELGTADYAAGAQVRPVLGGCVCCTGQAALIAEIRNALWFDGPDRLIVELSAQASIRDIGALFGFLPDCRLHQLLYVLNAPKVPAMAAVMGEAFSGEIAAAPVLVLNRWQAVPPEARDGILDLLAQWNPTARVLTGFEGLDPEANAALCRNLVPDPVRPGSVRRTGGFPRLPLK